MVFYVTPLYEYVTTMAKGEDSVHVQGGVKKGEREDRWRKIM